MASAIRHPWAKLADRFVNGEWDTYRAMATALVDEAKASGKKAPGLGQIEKQAAKEEWTERRRAVEAKARALADGRLARERADQVAAARKMFEQHQQLGGGLVALGAQYIRTLQEAEELARKKGKTAPGPITSTYEALAAIRVGHALAKAASDGILSLLPERPMLSPLDQGALDAPADEAGDPEALRDELFSKLLRIAGAADGAAPARKIDARRTDKA